MKSKWWTLSTVESNRNSKPRVLGKIRANKVTTPILVKIQVTWSAHFLNFRPSKLNFVLVVNACENLVHKRSLNLPEAGFCSAIWGNWMKIQKEGSFCSWEFKINRHVSRASYIQGITCDPSRANQKAEHSRRFPPANRTSNQNTFPANSNSNFCPRIHWLPPAFQMNGSQFFHKRAISANKKFKWSIFFL